MALSHMLAKRAAKDMLKAGGAVARPQKTCDMYREICKELPRCLALYEIDTPILEARAHILRQFRKNGHITDKNVINILISKARMDLEETKLQYKQG